MQLLDICTTLLKNLVAPALCCHCQTEGSFLCSNCYEQISYTTLPPLASSEATALDELICLGPFLGVTKSLLIALKYQAQIEVSQTIGQLLFHTLVTPASDFITAVPAHPDRVKNRGFNQAALIAQALAELKKIPFQEFLARTKKISPQASIQQKSERQNRQIHTMTVLPEYQQLLTASKVKTIIIIDDVFTTGATLNEAARALKAVKPDLTLIGLTVAHA